MTLSFEKGAWLHLLHGIGKKTALLLSVGMLCGVFRASPASLAADFPSVSAECAVLYEPTSGTVLWEKDAESVRPIASTTKIMTAVVTLENSSLSEVVKIPPQAVGVEGSSVYLREGESLTVGELLYAMMLESANDAAAALAYAVGGNIESFAALMNRKAEELGLSHTHYANPHGLDEEGNYSCALDLARLTAYALENEDFSQIVSTVRHVISYGDRADARLLINHNKLLRLCDGVIGVKTGYTKKSGRCLVSAAERNGVRLICVTLDAPDDWKDHAALYDSGFPLYERVELSLVGEQAFVMPVVGGELEFIRCRNEKALSAVLPSGGGSLEKKVELRRFYYAPIVRGEVLGSVRYYDGGILVGEVEITASHDVKQAREESLFGRLSGLLRRTGG